ncbi:hypothetical protein [Persicitalea sp.]|uniref:hypothetical protein n=1 Tax=Persicitalea sp. TaxID=3100273 RepID=UPI0035936953
MRAVVKKNRSHYSNPHLGYLTPVFVEREDRWVRVEDLKKDFPNNECIFIHRDYVALNEGYADNELFIQTYEQNASHNPEYDGSSLFTGTGENALAPNNSEFCRILDSGRPFDPEQEYWIWQTVDPLNDVFIRMGDFIYGPFNFSSRKIDEEDGVNLLLRAEPGLDYCIFKINVNDAEKHHHVHQDGSFYYLISVSELLEDQRVPKESIYYGSPTDLLDWAKNITDLSTVNDIRQLGKTLSSATNPSPVEQAKLNRLKSLLGNSDEWFSKRLPVFISQYLEENPIGKKKVEDYLRINEQPNAEQSGELKRLREELEQLRQQPGGVALDERLTTLPAPQQRLINELLNDGNLRLKYASARSLEAQIQQLEKDRERKKKLLAESTRELRLKEELKAGLEKSLVELKEHFSNTEEVRSKFFEVKPYIDWVNGIVPSTTGETEQNNIREALDALKLKEDVPPLREYLQEIRENLDRLDRRIEFNDLANYFITINQNFLTVFAGLPGVGKTSLVTKLAAAAGLKERFLAISTARGWTSQRDFIGYYNAISNHFQQARTGLFDVLKSCDAGTRRGLDIPYWVLLDEANLSPMEHYWSDFMRFTDPDSERVLRIPNASNLDELRLGQGLRFIATINYDHTTEPLSPRLLDRVAVVRLTAPKDTIRVEKPVTLPSVTDYYSTEQLEEMLNPSEGSYEMASNSLNLFNEIRELLENEEDGLPIIINPRKQRDVSKYCAIAQQVMEDNGNAQNAFDYAFNQQILPLIAGRGEKFGKRLNDLHDLIDQFLPSSALSLRRIIRNGDANYYNYRFFV